MLEELRLQLDREFEKEQFERRMKDFKHASLMRNLKLIASACHKIRERLLDNSRNCNIANNNGINDKFEKINLEFKRTLNDIIKCEPSKLYIQTRITNCMNIIIKGILILTLMITINEG